MKCQLLSGCGRKVLSVIGAILLASTAMADTWKDAKGVVWHYTVSGGKAVVMNEMSGSAIPESTSGAITVPSKLGGYPVTTIGPDAFSYCSKLTSVTIPSGVTAIKWDAFSDCSSLKSVTIPDTVTEIGFAAFSGCEALESVTIPAGVTILSDNVFYDCSSLKKVRIPDNVRVVGYDAFAGCYALNEVWIPKSVETIGITAFAHAPIQKIHVVSGDKARVVEMLEESGFDTVDVIFAQDVPEARYTVVYHKYDGSGTTRKQTFVVGESQRLLWMDSQLGWKRGGYEFIGWVPWNPDTKPRLCKFVNGEMVRNIGLAGSEVHLYAAWKSPSSYRVCLHYNLKGVDYTMNQVVLRNKEANLAWMDSQIGWTGPESLYPEYAFIGWCETPDAADVKYANGGKIKNLAMDGGTKHLYAKWRFLGAGPYGVRYNKYDGTGKTMVQVLWEDEPQRLLWMNSQLGWSRQGYEFAGWVPWKPEGRPRLCKYVNGCVVTNLNCVEEAEYEADFGEIVNLYAVWKSPSSYRVCFHMNDGGADEKMDQVILRNTDDNLAWMASQIGWVREGYVFRGWTDTPGSTTVKFANGAKVRNLVSNGGTKHLYAVWRVE